MTKEWPAYRDVIIQLYKTEGKSLENVRSIMAQRHDFKAAIRTYRNWLRKWGVWKYTRDSNKLRVVQSRSTPHSQHMSAVSLPGGLPTPPMHPVDRHQRSPGSSSSSSHSGNGSGNGYSPFSASRSRSHESAVLFGNQPQNTMQPTLSQSSFLANSLGPQGLYTRPPAQTLSLSSSDPFPPLLPATSSAPTPDALFPGFFSSSSTLAGDLALLKRSNLPFGIPTPDLSPYDRTVPAQNSAVNMSDNFYAQDQQRLPRDVKPLPRRQHSAHSWPATSAGSTAILISSMDPSAGEQDFAMQEASPLSPPMYFDPWTYDKCGQRIK